jgi:predicted nucleic-acid-binding protein
LIGLDTNVLVRFLTQDDPLQGRLAGEVMASLTTAEPAFVSREVLVEVVWVLERAYRFGRQDIARALTTLLEAEDLQIEAADRVGAALARYSKGGAGFADQMIRQACLAAGCFELVTFDKDMATESGVRLLT